MKRNKKIKLFFGTFIFIVTLLISFYGTSSVQASTEVYLSPSTQNIHVGDKFSLDLKISATKPSINVIDGVVVYDKDKLEIKGTEIEKSILSFWTVPAIFDNKIGQLSFVGGIGNGFVGQDGQVLRINFLAKREGLTKVDFKDSFAVYVNDGKGTVINPWLKPVELTIAPKIPGSFSTSSLIWWIIALILSVFVIIFVVRRYVLLI